MNHYSNHHSSSRNYYKNLQKNKCNNLNSSKIKINTLDNHLEKFLNLSYKYLSPLFEDEETIKSYKKDTTNNYIDKEVDQEITKHTPSLILAIISFFTKIYKKHFTKESRSNTTKTLKKIAFCFTNPQKTNYKMTNNFALNKSSP